MLILFFLQKLWRIVIDHFFGAGKPGAFFKRPAKVWPGVNSSSNNRDDYENIPRMDKLAIRIFREFQEHKLHEEARKLEEAAEEGSVRLLSSSYCIIVGVQASSWGTPKKQRAIASQQWQTQQSARHHNWCQWWWGQRKCLPSIYQKKHRTTVTRTDLFNMFTSAMDTVDPTSRVIATEMEQRNQMLQLAAQCWHDAEEHACHANEW